MTKMQMDERLLQYLMHDFQKGKKEALGEIMRLLYNDLYAYGLKILKDDALTKDCIQNLFYYLWIKRASLGTITKVKPYLLIALRREALKVKSSERKNDQQILSDAKLLRVSSREKELIDTQLSHEKWNQLQKVIASLSTKQREVIHLKFFEGMDAEEISQIMSIRLQSVYNLLSEALKTIRKHIVELSLIDLFFLSYLAF